MSGGEKWYDNGLYVALAFAAGVVVLVVGICAMAIGFTSAACSEMGERANRDTSYSWLSGCFVEVNGRMIPADSWRGEYE